MKISHRTHPILKILESKNAQGVIVTDDNRIYIEKQINNIARWFNFILNKKYSVYVLSKNFCESFGLARDRIYNSNLFGDIPSGNYCFTYNKEQIAITVNNDNYNGIIEYGVLQLTKIKDKFPLTIIGTGYFAYSENIYGLRYLPFDGFATKEYKRMYKETVEQTVANYLMIILFIRYADIKTKLLPPGQVAKDIECKYINDTKTSVTVLDSTWFTNLVKSDGFKVRGHFRLQPKIKNGLWGKELIWINDYIKTGYTKKAKKMQNI